jgi:hypothetical protein
MKGQAFHFEIRHGDVSHLKKTRRAKICDKTQVKFMMGRRRIKKGMERRGCSKTNNTLGGFPTRLFVQPTIF